MFICISCGRFGAWRLRLLEEPVFGNSPLGIRVRVCVCGISGRNSF